MRKFYTLLSSQLAVVSFVRIASAQELNKEPEKPSQIVVREDQNCLSDRECTELAKRAGSCFSKGEFQDASRLYRLAFELRADPRMLYGVARSLHKQERLEPALAVYRKFVASQPVSSSIRKIAERYIDEIQHLVDKQRDEYMQAHPESRQEATVPTRLVERDKPFFRKWWFWTASGLTVATLATAITLVVHALPPSYPSSMTVEPFKFL